MNRCMAIYGILIFGDKFHSEYQNMDERIKLTRLGAIVHTCENPGNTPNCTYIGLPTIAKYSNNIVSLTQRKMGDTIRMKLSLSGILDDSDVAEKILEVAGAYPKFNFYLIPSRSK